jgi:DNA-binding transcriptional LysR family regulator
MLKSIPGRGLNHANAKFQSPHYMPQTILDSRKLLAFETLARLGSFTQAARELSLTQSAVSHAIKALERDLGCRLFDRMGRSVTITPAGSQLLPHAGVILTEMQHARADLAVFSV